MSGELAVSFAIKLNDSGSPAAVRALQALTRALKETEGVSKTTSQAAITAFQKLANAREILGIRSEKAIQNEIRQTEAAYQRLVASGTAGARELARAQDAMRQKVGELRRELEGTGKSSFTMGNSLRAAVAGVGAVKAAQMVVRDPISQTMNYGMELAHASNTLYAGKSVAERVSGKTQINEAVMAGVREAKGGVTREDSLVGLKTLAASGEFGSDPAAAYKLLPTLTAAAAANNASVVDMANIAIKAKQTMGLTNVGRLLDMGAQGGIEGQFELRDMAKWLPQQMAYAKRTGLHGEQGFATLVAANQVAMSTAGSTDEAGNNVKNLLAKVNSSDTANDAKKLGIDLSGRLAKAQASGVGGLDAFLDLASDVASKDKRLVKLREQAKTATGDDLRANLDAQKGIIEGSAIGKLIQDQQAMAALVALLNGRGRFTDIRDKAMAANGTNADMLKVVADEPLAKANLLAAERANAMHVALGKVNPLLGNMAEGLAGLVQQYPGLAAAFEGTTLGVSALGAAAITAAGAITLLGGGGAAGAGGTAGKAAATAAKAASWLGPAGLAGAVGYAGGGFLNDGINAFVKWKTDGKEDSLGGWFHESVSQLVDAIKGAMKLDVNIRTENGNIAADIEQRNARQAKRH